MSIYRELLKRVISGDNKGDFFISYDLYKEIYEFLVHPEKTEQESVAWIATGIGGGTAVGWYEKDIVNLPKGTKLYLHPQKREQEQHGTQYLLDQVSMLRAENAMLKEKWSTPKREPLSLEELCKLYGDNVVEDIFTFARAIEKAHGIGGGE